MIRPKISVVIPSYNKAEFIGQTLESVANQRYPNLEIIIQDGGSTDGTVEIIKNFSEKFPKIIRWESKKDKGQLDAVNTGLKKATGDFITFINADDAYIDGAFRNLEKAYQKNPDALWVVGKAIVIDENNKEIAKGVTWYKNLLLHLNFRFCLLITNYLMQPSVFLTKKAIRNFGLFTGTKDFITEYDLWLKMSKSQMPVVVSENLSEFRIEPSTKTKTMFAGLLAEDRKIVGGYTKNLLILFLHELHNFGRILMGKFV